MKKYNFSELIKFDLDYLEVLINDLVEEWKLAADQGKFICSDYG